MLRHFICPITRKERGSGLENYPLPRFYTFNSKEEREQILYRNFVEVGLEAKAMIGDVLNKKGASKVFCH